MVFSSVLFLFAYLPAVLLGNYVIPKRNIMAKNLLLLIASSLFYFWGEQGLILVMYVCILLNYYGALYMTKAFPGRLIPEGEKPTFRRRITLYGTVGGSLALLGYYKYGNFFVENLNWLFQYTGHDSWGLHDFEKIALPLGISFYTFHALSYTLDVYKGKLRAETSFVKFAGYVVMFPQLVAGPIVRYRDIYRQFAGRVVTRTGFANGIRRFIMGMAKKVLIANTVAKAADGIFALPPDSISPIVAWLGVAAYTLQIFFDFSGYSDMAIGLGLMLGFRYKENFLHPYISTSMQEFWRRWHISLSNWLRDYLYIALGGSRKGNWQTYANLVIVFFFCGLWHGANWTFILWGLWHGAFQVLERSGLRSWLEKGGRWIGHLYVMGVVMVGWVFFRADTVDKAFAYIRSMCGLGGPMPAYAIYEYLQMDVALAICVGSIIICRLDGRIRRVLVAKAHQGKYHPLFAGYKIAGMILMVGLFLLSLMSLANGYYNPFIYFRF